MDMAKLLGGLGTVKAINNFYVQKDLTDLALIVSTIIFIAVENHFYNGLAINAAVLFRILLMARFWKTSRRFRGSDGGFGARKTVNDERFRGITSVADNFDPSRPDRKNRWI
jgi:hypothetical protein